MRLDQTRPAPQLPEDPPRSQPLAEEKVGYPLRQEKYKHQHCHAELEAVIFHPDVDEEHLWLAVLAEFGLVWTWDSRSAVSVERVGHGLEAMAQKVYVHQEGHPKWLRHEAASEVVDTDD